MTGNGTDESDLEAEDMRVCDAVEEARTELLDEAEAYLVKQADGMIATIKPSILPGQPCYWLPAWIRQRFAELRAREGVE
jgi:hypothetical protein